MSDDSPHNTVAPTSEVGTNRANEKARGENPDTEQWRMMLEIQNEQMRALIQALKVPRPNNHVTLPEFDPDKREADPQSWCATADLCLADNPLEGCQLIVALSKALKGTASTWLSQVTYSGITWPQFKELFSARFVPTETIPATLIQLSASKPKEGETYGAYASRLMSSLLNRWKNASTEQIAVSVVLAHLAQIDTRLHRLAFTTEINTRHNLQQELQAYSYLKRKAPQDVTDTSENAKRARMSTPPLCYICGKPGHKQADCRFKTKDVKKQPMSSTTHTRTTQQPTPKGALVCFKCGQPGHIASRCASAASAAAPSAAPRAERRVDLCVVEPPAGSLTHNGQSLTFHFDSGAECSLVKESFATKLSGRRYCNVVSLIGIGNKTVYSTEQILCSVEIDQYPTEILFHVLPDVYLRSDIMIGREILFSGFVVNISANKFSLTKGNVINACTKSAQPIVSDFNDVDTEISAERKQSLVKILQNYSEYFTTGFPTTRVNTYELEIRLLDQNKTVQRRPYRYSPEERKIMRERVNELLDAKIIRPSNSPFASPALFVEKSDGTKRMCVDYRELNKNTVPDRYPLPLISEQISRLNGANYFTKLDCASGFHLIPVKEDSIERTAFVTADGQYEFLAMPFGLRNAISVFQRALMIALGELANTYVIVYVDDLLIVSETEEQGLERLNTVLEVLTKAGFSLNLKKCSFLKTRVQFLGYEVEAGEIRPNKKKVEALTALPPPESVTQVRQFIGLASYFRQFIPNFSRLMAPLHRLTAGKCPFEWKENHELIRQQVISMLTTEPVLMIYDPRYPAELHTDASMDGYGAMLLQIVEGKRRVVGYYSKRTTPAESRYHSYELETLAVVNGVKHFRSYLHGRKFVVVTDCNSLKSSRDKIDLTPRVHRWWAYLQTFDFDVVYRAGKSMAHVDFFSRNHLPRSQAKEVTKVEQKRVNITELSGNWLLAEQQRDAEIQKIITQLNDGEINDDVARTYEVRSSLLYRKIQRNRKTKCLPVLPRSIRWSVVHNIHDSIVHLGWEKTLEKLYDHYWFEGMSRYVRKFVDNCVTCKVAKSNSGKVQAVLHPIPKATVPWHTVHIDATGKLSGKRDKKEYVFVLIDAFTKFVLLHHTMNIDTASSIKAVAKSVSLFGAPTRIIADQGRCFASHEFREFCDSKNIKLHLIATGSSRANGQVERTMSTLKSMFTAVEANEDRSWQDALGDVQLALNCTVNRVTKASPLELLIGKVARPLNLMANDDETEVDIEQARENAALLIEKSAQYEKNRFDSTKARLNKFSVGDFVLLQNEERNQTKLDPKYKGPFKVVEVLDGDRYTLRALNSRRTYKYAHDRLRRIPEGQVPLEVEELEASDSGES